MSCDIFRKGETASTIPAGDVGISFTLTKRPLAFAQTKPDIPCLGAQMLDTQTRNEERSINAFYETSVGLKTCNHTRNCGRCGNQVNIVGLKVHKVGERIAQHTGS